MNKVSIFGNQSKPRLVFHRLSFIDDTPKSDGQFKSREAHPRWKSDDLLLEELMSRSLGCLSLTKIMKKEGNRRYCQAACAECNKLRWLEVYNVLNGRTTNCQCQRGRKYPADSRAKTLGERYDAMVQRCNRWTHSSSINYKGRGIKVEFSSREDFIRWALETYPNTDFMGMHFDRIDNDGNYAKANLRLVTPQENARNKSRKKHPRYAMPRDGKNVVHLRE